MRYRLSCLVDPPKLGQMITLLYSTEPAFDPEIVIAPDQPVIEHVPAPHPAPKAKTKAKFQRVEKKRDHTLSRVEVLESFMQSGPKTLPQMREALEMANFAGTSLSNMLGPLQRYGHLRKMGNGLWQWFREPRAPVAEEIT